MKKLLIGLMVFTLSVEAVGQTIALEHEGREGIWIDKETAIDILIDLELKPVLEEQVDLLESQSLIKDRRIETLNEALSHSTEIEEKYKLLYDVAIQDRNRALELRDKWYRKPAFLITLGSVSMIAVQSLAIFIYKKAK